MKEDHVTRDELRSMFKYDPETGLLRDDSGVETKQLRMVINGKSYPGHRMVWLWHYGWLPKVVKRIDPNTSWPNRIENLKDGDKKGLKEIRVNG